MDIQLAARGVAEENKRLREENGRLREEGETLRAENERMRVMLEGKMQGRAEATTTEGYEAGASSHGIENALPEAPSQLQDFTGPQGEGPTTTTEDDELSLQTTSTQPQSPPEVSCSSHDGEMMVLGDDTSSCEYAAHIITSMRADISTDDVRADLGCGGDIREWRKCKVDNSKLFVAVDRYTG